MLTYVAIYIFVYICKFQCGLLDLTAASIFLLFFKRWIVIPSDSHVTGEIQVSKQEQKFRAVSRLNTQSNKKLLSATVTVQSFWSLEKWVASKALRFLTHLDVNIRKWKLKFWSITYSSVKLNTKKKDRPCCFTTFGGNYYIGV